MSAVLAPICLALGVIAVALGSWRVEKRNRRIPGVLKAPDPICRRSDFKIEPPTRSLP